MAVSSADHLIRRTRNRLFAGTLALLVLLVTGVGAATAILGLSSLDGEVDRALTTAVDAAVNRLDGDLPEPAGDHESDEQVPAAADTFILVVDPSGSVVENRSGIGLAGLPAATAISAAEATGRDLRSAMAGGVNVRLLTIAVRHDGETRGFVQGGFVLTLHDRQSQVLVLAIVGVGAFGLVAAAIITLFITGRALRPVREGFEAQRRFVADASHELRTPAALIRANAEVLEREGLVREDGRPLVTDVIAEADRLAGLVGDLLQLAAWDETRLVVRPDALDAAALASDTVRGATAFAAERGVRLVTDAPLPVAALADRDRFVQLLLILVDNAVDHSPSGGAVTIRVRAMDGCVRIDVDDEGPGIPPAERERIFEPFTRLTGTTRHGSGGTGLGLAIARRITDAHGGSIRAESPRTGGARFTVVLPAPRG